MNRIVNTILEAALNNIKDLSLSDVVIAVGETGKVVQSVTEHVAGGVSDAIGMIKEKRNDCHEKIERKKNEQSIKLEQIKEESWVNTTKIFGTHIEHLFQVLDYSDLKELEHITYILEQDIDALNIKFKYGKSLGGMK